MSDDTRSPFINVGRLYRATMQLYYDGGPASGQSTGWKSLDEFFTVGTGQFTVITGVPNHGKSEFIDALLVNLAEGGDWFFSVFAPENFPTNDHVKAYAEKRARKPFNAGASDRMSEQEAADAIAWVEERFMFYDYDAIEQKTPDNLLALAAEFDTKKKRGILLDPWNTLDHERNGMSETDYISYILTKVTQIARKLRAHIFLVVHPTKMQREKDGERPVPTPYDISGSAHWFNKADNILCVHRDVTKPTQDVDIHVQKVRFKHIGHIGCVTLKYDRVTGRYFEGPPGEPIIDPLTGRPELYADPERGAPPPVLDTQWEREREAMQQEESASASG